MNAKASIFDAIILSFFVVFITCQPFLLHHEIIMMETGIHLPGIYALFHGGVPYKDFFYLRGPLELYVPFFSMLLFGENMVVLPVFYYIGSVLTLLVCILLAYQIYRTRFIFYLMILVLIARTFPRISFYYWGGMRYALGLLSLFCAFQYFKKQRLSWIFAAGIVSCLGLLTTVETGVSAIVSIALALVLSFLFGIGERHFFRKALCMYFLGILLILIPYVVCLWATDSLIPYSQTNYIVLTKMMKIFVDAPGNYPGNFPGFLAALLPGSPYFKVMTPVFFYAAFGAYIFYQKKRNKLGPEIFGLVAIAIYAMILYIAAFRKIEGHHFEMALQPEKILFFFLLEGVYLSLVKIRRQEVERVGAFALRGWQFFIMRKKIYLINFLIVAFIGSSVGYALVRYNNRFVMVKLLENKLGHKDDQDLSFLAGTEKREVNIKRAKGMVVPAWQAQEMEEIVAFLEKNTKPDEAVFTYPELGNFNFWADRPFVGRFPIATFSWMDERWYEELLADFKKAAPRYVIMTNLGHRTFPKEWYFRNTNNVVKFNTMTELILNDYRPIKTFESVSLYERQ